MLRLLTIDITGSTSIRSFLKEAKTWPDIYLVSKQDLWSQHMMFQIHISNVLKELIIHTYCKQNASLLFFFQRGPTFTNFSFKNRTARISESKSYDMESRQFSISRHRGLRISMCSTLPTLHLHLSHYQLCVGEFGSYSRPEEHCDSFTPFNRSTMQQHISYKVKSFFGTFTAPLYHRIVHLSTLRN